MYYTPKERVDIGRRVFARELTQQDAARQYGVSQQSIINYVREYMKGKCTGNPKVDAGNSSSPFFSSALLNRSTRLFT